MRQTDVLGVLRDCSKHICAVKRRDPRARVRPAPNVPDTADALDVLEVIKGAPVHMALVHDEYGQIFRAWSPMPTFGSDRRRFPNA